MRLTAFACVAREVRTFLTEGRYKAQCIGQMKNAATATTNNAPAAIQAQV